MRKTFAALDDVLIERVFQPVSDLLSNQLQLSKAKAACFCVDAASLAWIVSRTPGLSAAVIAWDSGAAFLDLALLLLGLAALISLRSLFRRAMVGQQANPLRMAMRPHRGIVLLMLATRPVQLTTFDLTDAADLAMLLCAASALYLAACAQRPPVRRHNNALILAPVRG
jgi:hypothetical protein